MLVYPYSLETHTSQALRLRPPPRGIANLTVRHVWQSAGLQQRIAKLPSFRYFFICPPFCVIFPECQNFHPVNLLLSTAWFWLAWPSAITWSWGQLGTLVV